MSLYQRILAPVDGSAAAQHGLRQALALARDQGAALKLISVVDEAVGDYMGGELAWIDPKTLRDNLVAGAKQVLEAAARQAREAGIDVQSELIETPEGRIGHAILQAARAWQADLLVICTHGRHGLARLLLGSTTESVIRSTPLPILVVPRAATGKG
jgi:nucleotide-binding universal stress UspA family protein